MYQPRKLLTSSNEQREIIRQGQPQPPTPASILLPGSVPHTLPFRHSRTWTLSPPLLPSFSPLPSTQALLPMLVSLSSVVTGSFSPACPHAVTSSIEEINLFLALLSSAALSHFSFPLYSKTPWKCCCLPFLSPIISSIHS